MIEVDHEKREVYSEQMRMISAEELQLMQPSHESITARLTTPIVTTYIDTEKISFERNKSGLWGWRADKVEEVNGHECKVFAANNVELLTKTRIEHLCAADRAKSYIPKSPLQSFLGIAESEERAHSPTKDANVVSIFITIFATKSLMSKFVACRCSVNSKYSFAFKFSGGIQT
jgi:ankyrin repeat domain-containing protein 13